MINPATNNVIGRIDSERVGRSKIGQHHGSSRVMLKLFREFSKYLIRSFAKVSGCSAQDGKFSLTREFLFEIRGSRVAMSLTPVKGSLDHR